MSSSLVTYLFSYSASITHTADSSSFSRDLPYLTLHHLRCTYVYLVQGMNIIVQQLPTHYMWRQSNGISDPLLINTGIHSDLI